jgi:hypothetical protein
MSAASTRPAGPPIAYTVPLTRTRSRPGLTGTATPFTLLGRLADPGRSVSLADGIRAEVTRWAHAKFAGEHDAERAWRGVPAGVRHVGDRLTGRQ